MNSLNGLSAVAVRRQEQERRRKQQRIDYEMRKQGSSNTLANDSVTFQQKHYSSMTDALKEVRKSNVTHEDTTQVTRPNSKGLHQ